MGGARAIGGLASLALASLLAGGCGGDSPPLVFPSPAAAVPLPPRVVSGVVVSIDGGPIEGARVWDRLSVDTVSARDGTFGFTYPAEQRGDVEIAAAGYESSGAAWNRGQDPVALRVRLQPRVLVPTGTRLSLPLTNDDLGMYVGEPYESDYCSPCKVIRFNILPDRPVTVVRAEWMGPDSLQMWAADGTQADLDGSVLVVRTIGQVHIGLKWTSSQRRTLTGPVTLILNAE